MIEAIGIIAVVGAVLGGHLIDRKSTRLNSSHLGISYAVFCLKKKKKPNIRPAKPPNKHETAGTDNPRTPPRPDTPPPATGRHTDAAARTTPNTHRPSMSDAPT